MVNIKCIDKTHCFEIHLSTSDGFLVIGKEWITKLKEALLKANKSRAPCIALVFHSRLSSKGPPIAVAGGNLREMSAMVNSPTDARDFFGSIHDLLQEIKQLPALVIGVGDGLFIGGAAEFLLGLDYVVLGKQGALKFSQLQVGLPPGFGGEKILMKAVGPQRTLAVLAGQQTIFGPKALEMGLIAEYSEANITDILDALHQKFSQFHPACLLSLKKMLGSSNPNSSLDYFLEAWGNEHYRKTLEAYKK